MSVVAIVGANWGDEGKGKITDYLAKDAQFVVRFQGGNNAGHTIINQFGKFALHLLPSGVFYPNVTNVIGPGVAVNIRALLQELDNLKQNKVPEPHLRISHRAQVLLPIHALMDQAEEELLGQNQFGSTRSGIAPFYSDKALKVGIQVADVFASNRLRERVTRLIETKEVLLKHRYGISDVMSVDEIMELLRVDVQGIASYVCDTSQLLHDALKSKKNILLEGQLGALRDPDQGIFPFVTSSSPLAGFASVGAGIPPHAITRIVAVTKAYSTCVGAGPFVTELTGTQGEWLRKHGADIGEYGATTGRPRRVGWFDAVATRYGCRIQGATEVALTNLDVLSSLQDIPVATGYKIHGKVLDTFPTTADLFEAEPIFEIMPGWQSDISQISGYDKLPSAAKNYIERLEELVETPISWISYGPRRDQIMKK